MYICINTKMWGNTAASNIYVYICYIYIYIYIYICRVFGRSIYDI